MHFSEGRTVRVLGDELDADASEEVEQEHDEEDRVRLESRARFAGGGQIPPSPTNLSYSVKIEKFDNVKFLKVNILQKLSSFAKFLKRL